MMNELLTYWYLFLHCLIQMSLGWLMWELISQPSREEWSHCQGDALSRNSGRSVDSVLSICGDRNC